MPKPLTDIKGIGPALSVRLNKIGIHNAEELLFHLPKRYIDKQTVRVIGDLYGGEHCSVIVTVTSNQIQFGRRRSLVINANDDSGSVTLRFFNFNNNQKQRMAEGATLKCFGEVQRFGHSLTMIHPEVSIIDKQNNESNFKDNNQNNRPSLTPVYPTTEGIHQLTWLKVIPEAFKILHREDLQEFLKPEEIQRALNVKVPNLLSCLKHIHQLENDNLSSAQTTFDSHNTSLLIDDLALVKKRLALEELTSRRLVFLNNKIKQTRSAPALCCSGKLKLKLLSQLPFQLTEAQQRVIEEIKQDLTSSVAMTRLIQGDVGSGKTIVACFAALEAIENDFQIAIMAPTEILAEQHFLSFSGWLEPLGICTQLLTSKIDAASKRQALTNISDGTAAVVVGTQALIQEQVCFQNLALVIVDEQHRFGVDQRKVFREKRLDGLSPHQLIMTATPIPRTLAMTFFADMDYSVIDELPKNRQPIVTAVMSDGKRQEVIAKVHSAVKEKRQAYWVCTLVEESELLDCQAAETTAKELQALLPDIRIGLVHGRLKAQEKAAVMTAFKNKEIDLLVATTVIEVGVDVPNASLMVIENAERLGLSQLHQLRGRVGRGGLQSHCLLVYSAPLSKNAKRRLEIMRQSNDGFEIAEEDLKIRGPGEILGTQQSGVASLKIADLEEDADLINASIEISSRISEQNPEHIIPLTQRWMAFGKDYIDV